MGPQRQEARVSFRVRLTRDAEADLERLFGFVRERELERDGGDLALAERALAAIRAGFATLRTSPFTCRKAGNSPFMRELIPRASQCRAISSRHAPPPGRRVISASMSTSDCMRPGRPSIRRRSPTDILFGACAPSRHSQSKASST